MNRKTDERTTTSSHHCQKTARLGTAAVTFLKIQSIATTKKGESNPNRNHLCTSQKILLEFLKKNGLEMSFFKKKKLKKW